MKFKIKKRCQLIIYIYSLRSVSALQKYGNLMYVSKHDHYAVLNVDRSRIQRIGSRLRHLHFVKAVFRSPLTQLSGTLADQTARELGKDQ